MDSCNKIYIEYVGQADYQTNSKEIFAAPSRDSRFPTKISQELVISITFHSIFS